MAYEGKAQQKHSSFFRMRASPLWTLITIALAVFNDVFLFGALIPVLPYTLPIRFHVKENQVQGWISVLLSGYGGALLLGSIIFGWLGDFIPRRRLVLIGLVMLTLATALLAIPGHIEVLVVARIFQGLSAAVVWTSGLALITETYGKANFGEMLGYVLSAQSAGTTSAPLLGGLVYYHGGYQAVTIMTLATIVINLVMRLLMTEDQGPPVRNEHKQHHEHAAQPQRRSRDGPDGCDRSDLESDGSDETITGTPTETDSLLDKPKSKVKTNPAGYFMLLQSPRIVADLWGIFTYACLIISFETLLPHYVKQVFHWDSRRSGLMFLAWVIPGFLAPLAGKLSDKIGSRWVVLGAFLAATPPLALLRMVNTDTVLQQVLLYALLVLVGLALAFVTPPLLSDIVAATAYMKQLSPERFGDSDALTQVYALFVCAYSSGALVGPALASALKIWTGWGGATLMLAIVCGSASIPVAFFSGGRKH